MAPKNIATGVMMTIGAPGSLGAAPTLPGDAIVRAQLRGPALAAPLQLAGLPNQLLAIPPLPLTGLYVLENIRLEAAGRTLLPATPGAVTIEVIERVLAAQVTTRALTAKEIQDKGIFFDETNFRAVQFTVAYGVLDKKVPISFPMLLPRNPQGASAPVVQQPHPAGLGGGLRPDQPIVRLPGVGVTQLGISGFSLECVSFCDTEIMRLMPPIPGVLIFPGNISYLNQFFSALLLVSNVAPDGSRLNLRDIKAEIQLPAGKDGVANSGDDPLRMARRGTPPQEQNKLQPVVQPGADGILGSADDIATLAPGADGNAEFLLEGRREGVHTVEVKITATLDGLPSGPVQLQGRAVGVLEVRDPQFALTLNHPVTINAGEEYDFFVTVSNVAETPANFVNLSLLPRSITGAELLSDAVVQLDTILPGDSATATFRLRVAPDWDGGGHFAGRRTGCQASLNCAWRWASWAFHSRPTPSRFRPRPTASRPRSGRPGWPCSARPMRWPAPR